MELIWWVLLHKPLSSAFELILLKLLPQVGGSARATNTDYTKGKLKELIEIVATSGAVVFVSAVGVPPQWAVELLHSKNVLGWFRYLSVFAYTSSCANG